MISLKELPNISEIEGLLKQIDKEYDMESRLGRYATMAPELLDLAKDKGLIDPQDASRALFIADFIVTSSEVPTGVDDEERRISVITSFIDGLTSRCGSSDALMRVFYLAYNLAQQIRRKDLFLSGRGLDRETTLVRIMDAQIIPYLTLCEQVLGPGNVGWELGVLSAALKRQLPDKEIKQRGALSNISKLSSLVEPIWNVLTEYSNVHKVEVNDNPVIPNIDSTSSLLVLDANERLISRWNIPLEKRDYKQDQKAITPLRDFLRDHDKSTNFIYLRGKLLGSEKESNLILIRNPFHQKKPFVLLRTEADEVNVSEILSILYLKGGEGKGWSNIAPELEEIIMVEESAPSSVPKASTPHRQEEEESIVKKVRSLFGRFFGKKEKSTSALKPKTPKRPKSMKSKRIKTKDPYIPDFVAKAIAIDAVGDLKLFEMFDTFRESQYVIEGVIESDFGQNRTVFLTSPVLENPEAIASMLDGLDEVIEQCVNHFFVGEFQLLPEEIVLAHDENLKYIFCMAGNEDRLVGTIGATFQKDITEWQNKREEYILQRRTLHMRTGQLLSSRRHTPLDEAVQRIYGEELSSEVFTTELDHAVLKLT